LEANPNTLEPERLLHVCPAACVIAQQYSSATFRLIAPPFSQGKIQKKFFLLLIFLDGFKSRKTEIPNRELYAVFLIASLLSKAESGD
jgi:hypothetical protein